jgi:hypothetical protein
VRLSCGEDGVVEKEGCLDWAFLELCERKPLVDIFVTGKIFS